MALLLDAPLTSTINGFDAAQANGQSVALVGGEVAPIPGYLEITAAPDGSTALRSRIHPGDALTYGGIRSEIDWIPEANAERWYVWEVFHTTGFSSAEQISFMQIHDSPDGGESPVKFPNFEFMSQGGKVFCMVPINCPAETSSAGRVPAGQQLDLVTGRWVRCALHTNWATDSTGYLEVFYDGNLLAREWFRACGYADAVGPYIKLGLYDFTHGGLSASYAAYYRNARVYSSGHAAYDVLGVQPRPIQLKQLVF